jgi:hypothetical protein
VKRKHPATLTVGELAAALLALPDQDAPVIAVDPASGWYLNVQEITPNDEENFAAMIETTDDFDTRQW